MNKEGSYKPLIWVMVISLAIAFFWDSLSFIKNAVHYVLNPSAGWLLNWNLTVGMLILVFLLSVVTVVVQKYTTDQNTLKELKKEQKEIQAEMKKFKNQPEKFMALQKKSMESFPKTFKLSMGAIIYTAVPFILFFKWFWDFFTAAGNPKFFGFMGWIVFYIVFSLIFSTILRKILKVV